MNRYDLFRLVRDMGQLIENAHDKTAEAVAQELIDLGQRMLAEAKDRGRLNQCANGTSIPAQPIEPVAQPASESTVSSGIVSVPTDAAQA